MPEYFASAWYTQAGWWQVIATVVLTCAVSVLVVLQLRINRRLTAVAERKTLVLEKESDRVLKCFNAGTVDVVIRTVTIDDHTYSDTKPQLLPAGAPEHSHIDIRLERAELTKDGTHHVKIALSRPFTAKIAYIFLAEYDMHSGAIYHVKSFGVINKARERK